MEHFRSVVAVEPDAEMRGLIHGVEALSGSAEAIPLANATVDAVFCGEAFHWFDGPRALAEIARVLRPGGALVLLWNVWEDIEPELPEEARAFVRETSARAGEAGGPKYQSSAWRDAFAGSAFGELHEDSRPATWPLDREGVIALFLSMSNMARLPEEERAAFAARLRELVPDGRRLLELRLDRCWTSLES